MEAGAGCFYDKYYGRVDVSHGWSALFGSLLFILGFATVLVLPVFGDSPDGLAFAMAWIIAPAVLWVFIGTALIALREIRTGTKELPRRSNSPAEWLLIAALLIVSTVGYVLLVG